MPDERELDDIYAVEVLVPGCTALGPPVDANVAAEVLVTSQTVTVHTRPNGTRALSTGERLVVPLVTSRPDEGQLALEATASDLASLPRSRSLARAKWRNTPGPGAPDDALASYERAFIFDPPGDGLRPAQRGALHAVLGHWTTGDATPATVVMPTGTGKTDTMISLLVAGEILRLLVVVPSDALRTQLANSFETLGVLPRFGCVSDTARRPIVGQIRHVFTDGTNAHTFVKQCNVVVATVSVITAMSDEVRNAFLEGFSTLFVDEAHHVAATKWRVIRDAFAKKHVVQFTATPYREDGKHLGGRLVYAYPLSEAQRHGFFSELNYISVPELGRADEAIADKAITRLRRDLANGLDHILMARVNKKTRADEVLALYRQLAPDLNPVMAYSGMKAAEKRAAETAIGTKNHAGPRSSRILVCVNMFGEGFDLPQLKVAAIHDAHKSLGITLQFIGRFTRTAVANIGAATVVVGRPDRDFDEKLRALYAEDSDWNTVIQDLSERAVGRQQDLSDFERNFGTGPDDLSIQSLAPKMSTAVFRVPGDDDWDPIAIYKLYGEELLTDPIGINQPDGVAWFVTEHRTPVGWGQLKTVQDTTYTLYVLYWDRDRRLLYVNSSNTGSMHEGLADQLCKGAELVKGENVYRVMGDLDRLVPTNVGLLDARNSARRFTFLVGPDVGEGFPASEAQTKSKTHIFSYGFDHGERVNVGASLKGRLWSHLVAHDLPSWMSWCDAVGTKLLDETISVDAVMANFIRPQVVKERPALVPLALEWPWELYLHTSPEFRCEHDGTIHPIVDLDLVVDLTNPSTQGPILFSLQSPDWEVRYRLDFVDETMRFEPTTPSDAQIVSRRGDRSPFSAFLNEAGLLVHFEDDTLVEPPGVLYKPPGPGPLFDPTILQAMDWDGIDLRVESRGVQQRTDSIQHHMIEHVRTVADWDLLLDDDGTGEVADIVGIRVDDDHLVVHLTHCKYAINGTVGTRVDDLYDAIGQANRSTKWKRSTPSMFDRLRRREAQRLARGAPTGFVIGDSQTMYTVEELARGRRMRLTVAVAQPGLSASRLTDEQKTLLASMETYVKQTTYGEVAVYCSA